MERKELSKYETKRIAEALHVRHEAYLQEGERFELSGHVAKNEIYVQMLLHNADDSFYYPVECRLDPAEALLKVNDALDLALDFLDYYFGRYFREERDVFLAIDWTVYDFEDKKIQAKGQIQNLKLEQMAEDWIQKNKTAKEA